MKKPLTLATFLLMGSWFPHSASAQFMSGETSCPPPILSRMERHKIRSGESIDSIAQAHGLLPETLIRLNPSLQQETVSVGTEILIPPFNGVRLKVPEGTTWQDLEANYGVRADVLFELNGCTKQPNVVFIPGVAWEDQDSDEVYNYNGLSHYPLPESAPVGQEYGFYQDPSGNQRRLHSGIDLMAEVGTSVLAAEKGTVTFAGKHPRYGNLVIIVHEQGTQTRYAHLDTIQVQQEQSVKAGETIGTVGSSGKPNLNQPHLHFQVRYETPQGWVAQDPQLHLNPLQ